ncbi:MAG: SRPBCC family protein [Mycobacteriales bacterium]
MTQASSTRSIEVAAEPSEVMAVIADFAAYPDWARSIKETEILSARPDGRADLVRFRIDAAIIKDTYELAYDWADDGLAVSWQLAERSATMAAQRGSYRLAPCASGTAVTYALAVELAIALPGILRRKAEQVVMDTALSELRARVER